MGEDGQVVILNSEASDHFQSVSPKYKHVWFKFNLMLFIINFEPNNASIPNRGVFLSINNLAIEQILLWL